MPKFTTCLSVAAVALAALTCTATAQDFPNKPIQLMVAFPAGGSTDIAARIVASIAEKALGQPIVIVNRGGAGGQIGWTELVRQRPDGYYIGFINLPATNTVILDPERKAIFTEKDFTPIINQVLDPGARQRPVPSRRSPMHPSTSQNVHGGLPSKESEGSSARHLWTSTPER